MISPSLSLFDLQTSSAVLSDCGRHRYRLDRRWGPGQRVLFCMLNPSIANAEQDDRTTTKCIGFAKRLGAGGLILVNLFSWIDTDPDALIDCPEPVGPDADRHIREAVAAAGLVIVAWGGKVPQKHAGRAREVEGILRASGREVFALKVNGDGSPGHPLYLPGNSPLRLYEGPEA